MTRRAESIQQTGGQHSRARRRAEDESAAAEGMSSPDFTDWTSDSDTDPANVTYFTAGWIEAMRDVTRHVENGDEVLQRMVTVPDEGLEMWKLSKKQFTIAAYPPSPRPAKESLVQDLNEFCLSYRIPLHVINVEDREDYVRCAVGNCRSLRRIWGMQRDLRRCLRWRLEPIPPRRFRLRITGVPDELEPPQIVELMFTPPNSRLMEEKQHKEEIKIVTMWPSSLVMLVPPEIVWAARRQGFVHIQGKVAKAELYPKLDQCINCGELGHSREGCTKAQTCPYCGLEGHYDYECPGRDDQKYWRCAPCLRRGIGGDDSRHNFYDRDNCPILETVMRKYYAKVDLRVHVYRYLKEAWDNRNRCAPRPAAIRT